MSSDKLIKRFLGFSTVSAIGNSCADWALFFYALDKIEASGDTLLGLSKTSLFYIAFGLGRMLLAPLIAVFFDKLSKRYLSVTIDSLYALLLLLAAILFGMDLLTNLNFLIISILIHTFSQIHMQSIGFSAVKKHSSQSGGRYLATVLSLSNGLGIAVSGILFSLVGFYWCMVIGIVTFIPVIISYFFIFDKDEIDKKSTNVFSDLSESIKFLKKDGVLLKFGAVLAVFNVVGALFPAYIKLEINNSFSGNNYLATIILAGGLIFSTLFYKKIELNSNEWAGRFAFTTSLFPIFLSTILAYLFPNILTLSLLYLTACFGSGLRNIVTAKLRTTRVPKEMISRVNTVYGSMLNIGPFLGGIFVIPLLETNIKNGLAVAMSFTFLAVVLSFLGLPKMKVSELSKELS